MKTSTVAECVMSAEDAEEYRVGGYHPVEVGDAWRAGQARWDPGGLGELFIVSRYRVEGKLGWGTFSTVWRCSSKAGGAAEVAIKVMKSDEQTTEVARDEVRLLRAAERGGGGRFVVRLLEEFKVEGPHGTHMCIAMELLGPNLLTCLPRLGMHLTNVKAVMRGLLAALHHLHTKADIIHTDVKLENVLVVGQLGEEDFTREVAGLAVKLADLGSACWVGEPFSMMIGTQEYRAPEVLLGADYSTPTDVWSAACVAFELATGDYLFESEAAEGRYTRDEDHLAVIIELLGAMPRHLVTRGRRAAKFFRGRGAWPALRNVPMAETIDLPEVLRRKYEWEEEQVEQFTAWILPMLQLVPEDRVAAGASSLHSFLAGEGVEVAMDQGDLGASAGRSTGGGGAVRRRVARRSGTARLRMEVETPGERRLQAKAGHRTAPGLPPIDTVVEEVLEEVADTRGLCSGAKLLTYLGEWPSHTWCTLPPRPAPPRVRHPAGEALEGARRHPLRGGRRPPRAGNR